MDSGSFSALHSALDTPAVRSEFVSTLTAPVVNEKECSTFFLFKLLEYIQPPPKDAAPSSTAISRPTSRQLLRNFVEDLLQMLFAPEFPIAEVLLLRLVQLLLLALDGQLPIQAPQACACCEGSWLNLFVSSLSCVFFFCRQRSSL
jgi:hypothetical protein